MSIAILLSLTLFSIVELYCFMVVEVGVYRRLGNPCHLQRDPVFLQSPRGVAEEVCGQTPLAGEHPAVVV